ncbi:glucose 1-dehydrogenase [Stella sp.]|uniref:glucose 1-dehydrogenase n=1 Tax=Stella sp. TaxID=2912054 RepID=UPI0035B21995
MADLGGRAIVVTGAARGIGAAIARGLAAAGARVALADRDLDGARAVAAEIGGSAIALAVEVTERATVQAMIATTLAAFGRLDAIFNNAGIVETRDFLGISEADWRRMLDVNALGCLIGMQEAARAMIARGGGGKIVNTASIAGRQGSPALAHYSASKFAVVSLTQSGARALAPHGITVNAICPGVVETGMWDIIDRGYQDQGLTQEPGEAFRTLAARAALGRPSQPDDLVGIACFLASSGSDFMTGQSLVVDGGIVMQ